MLPSMHSARVGRPARLSWVGHAERKGVWEERGTTMDSKLGNIVERPGGRGHCFRPRLASRALLLCGLFAPAGLFADALVMNDGDPGTTELGLWSLSTDASEAPFGGSALYRNQNGTYTFKPTIASGTYKIYLWWTTRNNLARGVPVTVLTATGKVSQK